MSTSSPWNGTHTWALAISALLAVACSSRGSHVPLAPGLAVDVPRAIPSPIPFVSLEGPYWVAKGGYLVFSDVVEQNGPAAKIYRWEPRTGTISVLPYPNSPISTNGLATDGEGGLIACERWNGSLARVSGGKRKVVADHGPDGLPLNAPNDVVIRGDGNIYFSDTTWGAKPGAHAPTAIYRIAADGTLSVAFPLHMPNGVALSPDGATLYVGSDTQDRLWRLPVAADGSVGAPEPFAAKNDNPQAQLHVPDGLCIDDRGRVYVANNSDDVSAIVVFDKEGRFVGRIPLPAPPSNCTFGGEDRRTLFVTTLHAIYEVRVETPGLP